MPNVLKKWLDSLSLNEASELAAWLDETPDAIQEICSVIFAGMVGRK